MTLFLAMFGLGLGWMRHKTTATPPASGPGGPGSPQGLLLTLTYSS